jgi:hypothetical protein
VRSEGEFAKRLVFDFAGVIVGEEDVQEDTDYIAEEGASGTASDQGLNRPESKPVSQRKRHRETRRAKNQSYK